MDSEKKWGCIGYALLALITWGLTQGFKVVCIIIGILIAILIAFIFISNLSTKRLIKKFKHQKDIYPNAYSFFRKELRIFQSENNLTKQDINKFLSFPKVEWEKREKLELERIQREKQVSTEYNMIKANYSDGLTCWQKEHPSANKSIIISNITEIIDFDRRQKEFLSTEEWEKAQIAFSKLCRSKKSTTPHSGCYFYNMNFQKTDYKGNIIQGEYRIWQFFFSSFCTATDLDYTHFKQTQENNINIDKYKEGKINTPSYINIEISNFIKSLGVPVQVIAYGAEFDENLQVQFLTLDLAVLGFQSCALHHIDELSSNYVVIIDGVTTQDLFVKRCESVIQKFKHQKPCIVYISLMKEFSREEMQKLIDKKNIEVQQQKQIKDEINSISNALKSADIETAKEKVKKVKDFALSKSVDKELIDVICKTEKKIESDYAVGVVDDFDVQYVDYLMPSVVQDKSNWKYPVTKYPEDGCIVFPYRRKAIARRGFSEAKFQNYLQDTFRGCDLLILGDCNILPVEDNRPFEPDIAIICKKHPSIRIDIEIDEPYAAFTRKPIHYIGCGDDFRDALLNNIGWIVIRFTEYQVFSNPKGCAAFIAQVLHYIQPSMVLPIDFLSCSTPKEIERWTEIEAKVMASENTREKYLNHEFGIVDNEKLEIADIAGMYMYGQKFEEGLNYLYRSINQLAMFPNRYWNSDYGLAGAANTFRLLLLMCPKNHMELYRKIYSYDYLYLTKLACTTNDEIFQQEAYVNRASIAMDSMARYIIPININPDLLYISDMYYAHYCNELATQISISSGWKYNMKSLTYYQHASIKPNDTGGYVDIEEKTYNEIVSAKHEQAKSIALLFYTGICAEDGKLTSRNIESLFKILQYECRYNYKETRKRVLNFKSYK